MSIVDFLDELAIPSLGDGPFACQNNLASQATGQVIRNILLGVVSFVIFNPKKELFPPVNKHNVCTLAPKDLGRHHLDNLAEVLSCAL
jgi:hypothetical protein